MEVSSTEATGEPDANVQTAAGSTSWADVVDDAAEDEEEAMEIDGGAAGNAAGADADAETKTRKRQRGGDKENKRLNKKRRKEEKAKAAAAEGKPVPQHQQRKDPNERTVFITNLAFSTKEETLLDWFKPCGPICKVVMGKDKATARPVGFAHVVFENKAAIEEAVKYDEKQLLDRVVRVAQAGKDQHIAFRLPGELEEEVRIIVTKYEGMNISCIKGAWEKQHPGQKFDVQKYGFKNFSMAMKSITGIVLETHLEKSLTFVAFSKDSDAHASYLKEKQARAERAVESQKALQDAEAAQPPNGDVKMEPRNGQDAAAAETPSSAANLEAPAQGEAGPEQGAAEVPQMEAAPNS
eukprot:CAMPEP_0178421854 /NCGR_PEP_ID=MMETSP0689_2-20121128/26866_1 /TAXON_ID=160604 /ORGANISM="Amphidinium massartii, Strain CS-259" /LENGTH=352 /DNA_ID=CAMNT_0020043387 /DNA_START=66 /DNA_END=1120 /DNA_ORIENTATION=-